MLSQLRTVGAGIGVLAICVLLASASWQFILLGFAVASVAWAIYSWSQQLSSARRIAKQPRKQPIPLERRRRAVPRNNVYSFPSQEWGNQSTGM